MGQNLDDASTDYSSKFNQGVAKALCYLNRQKKIEKNLNARCLIIKCGADFLQSQYLAMVNAAFAAEAMQGNIQKKIKLRKSDEVSLMIS